MTSGARAIFLALTFCSSFCQGCLIVPMKAPTKSSGASGEGVKGKVDLAFMQEGRTSREEVLEKLGWINTRAGDQSFFLGRWSSSSSGTAWFLAGNGPSGMGGWNRNWKTHNLLIEFDERNVVTKYRTFPDSQLVRELAAQVAESSEAYLDPSKQVEVSIQHRHGPENYRDGTLFLSSDSFSYHEDGDKRRHDFAISPKEIQEIRVAGWRDPKDDADHVDQAIYFKKRTAVGRKLTVRVRVADLMILVKYWLKTKGR